jgi:hypothetical protein
MLSGSRNAAGMGVGAIPYPVITAWARDRGIEDPDEIELLVFGVQALDGVYLEHIAATMTKGRRT